MSVLPISFLHSFLFPFLLPFRVSFQMAFIPRRSPRFSNVDPATPASLRTKEQSREIVRTFAGRIVMDPEDRQKVVSTTKQYLDRVDVIKKNRAKKARIVIAMCEYLIQQPFVLAAYSRLTSVIQWKMQELQQEHIRNLEVRQAFQKAVADLLFVVS